MRAAAFVFFAAFVLGLAPSVIARARRNHRARQARKTAAACHANYWADSEPWEAWEPAEGTPLYDRLVCEQLESQFGGGAA